MEHLFSPEMLLELAGKAAFERGRRYYAEGRVRLLEQEASSAEAEVRGTQRYRVSLAWHGGALDFDCDCPVGMDGACCKHVVAVGLALAEKPAGGMSALRKPAAAATNLATFLRGQSTDWLADTLLALAHEHPEIQRRLELRRQVAGETDATALKKSLSALLGRPRFLDYRQSLDYARRLDELADMLQQLLAAGKSPACAELCEYALEKLFRIYESSDDSSGAIGDRLHEIAGIYREACAGLRDDAALPKRLFKLLLQDDWGIVAIADFAEVLGDGGMAAWETLVENAYAGLPPVLREEERYGKAGRILMLMEGIARRRGDVELLIRLNAREMRYANDYARLAMLCHEHGRPREAVQWAERGLGAFPRDSHLRGLLAEMYRADGLDAEALELLWQNFCDRAGPQHYLALKQAAEEDWPAWRSRALDAMREAEQRRFRQQTGNYRTQAPDCTARIECLLAEDALDEARAAAAEGVCHVQTRLELARRIAPTHPAEAAANIRPAVPMRVAQGNNAAYAEAVGLLNELRPLLGPEQFGRFIEELRCEFKAKRNFIKLLDAADFNR